MNPIQDRKTAVELALQHQRNNEHPMPIDELVNNAQWIDRYIISGRTKNNPESTV